MSDHHESNYNWVEWIVFAVVIFFASSSIHERIENLEDEVSSQEYQISDLEDKVKELEDKVSNFEWKIQFKR